MSSFRIEARRPRGAAAAPPLVTDPEALGAYLEDAAHYPGGHALAVAQPRSEADVATVLRHARSVLPIGAQSSLTGGATPMGDVVLSTARLASIVEIGRAQVRVQAGVPLVALQEALAQAGLYYPPAPTYTGAFVGGTVATNAAGAATWKYGSTRDWVRALTAVLASGEVLDVVRGEVHAHTDGYFEIAQSGGTRRVLVPSYHMPEVPKRSAGYFAMPNMDLIDLFIGSEGTLGVITEVTLDVVACAPAICLALVPMPSEQAALGLVAALRNASRATWHSHDSRGIDVAGIEHMDRRCLELLREDGSDRKNAVSFRSDTGLALLVQVELPSETTHAQAYEEIGAALSPEVPDTPLVRLCRLFEEVGVLDEVELALPGNRRRAEQLLAVREAVPAAVNQRVGLAKRTTDPTIVKTAADMIVPFPRFGEMMEIYREGFERRGLDYAVWGHISDGHVHPNVIPRSAADVENGQAAILEFGRQVMRLGGCPLAEHGVGRSPVKQALLKQLYGAAGVEQMRAVKRALDPEGKLAPGVLFAP